jgi:hypothetical protein
VTEPGQLANAFSAMIEKEIEAVEVVDDRMLFANGTTIANLAIAKRLRAGPSHRGCWARSCADRFRVAL